MTQEIEMGKTMQGPKYLSDIYQEIIFELQFTYHADFAAFKCSGLLMHIL